MPISQESGVWTTSATNIDSSCAACGNPIDDYSLHAQSRYFETETTPETVCWDCITIYETDPEVSDLFDQIRNQLMWADRWKWETAAFEDKFRYAIRVCRLRESGVEGAVITDPRRPRLPDTAPPQNAAYQTALEYTLAEPSDRHNLDSERPWAIDLFCGAGGASLGMLDSEFAVIGIEHDENARLAHTLNLSECRDINLRSPQGIPGIPRPQWVHASPPCKGFSRAGQQQADDDRNELTWTTLEWVELFDPTVFTLEQVPGFKDGGHHRRLRAALQDCGYDLTMEVVNAAEYGVPQHRKRLIVVATKKSADISPSLPAPTHAPTPQTTLSGDRLDGYTTVGDVLPVERDHAREQNHNPPNHTDRVSERFARLDPGQNITDLENPGTKKASQRRLDPDEPAPTVTCVPSDFVHPSLNRCLTNRELARIQSFPDWFRFTGPQKGGGGTRGEMTTQADQIGNAVPPRLMQAIGTHVYSLLENGE